MNKRAIVITEWNGLKEKINTLKLSEKDKQIAKYLNKSIFNRPLSWIERMGLDKLQEIVEKEYSEIAEFEVENDILVDWWANIWLTCSPLMQDWIKQRRVIIDLREEEKKLELFYEKVIEIKEKNYANTNERKKENLREKSVEPDNIDDDEFSDNLYVKLSDVFSQLSSWEILSYCCRYCENSFQSEIAIYRHIENEHPKEEWNYIEEVD